MQPPIASKIKIVYFDHFLPALARRNLAWLQTQWLEESRVARTWQKDASLWTNSGEDRWLGWLDLGELATAPLQQLRLFSHWVREEGFRELVVLGMGGSSLAPLVFSQAFAEEGAKIRLTIIDTIDPTEVIELTSRLNLPQTLFVVSSKSGTTLEARLLLGHFWQRIEAELGAANAGRHFVAVTDPQTPLESKARAKGFAHVFLGRPDVGGRFSALSLFGLLPLACVVAPESQQFAHLQARLNDLVAACRSPELDANPGAQLGLCLASCARAGLNKWYLSLPESSASLGFWLEQLLAESLGKGGCPVLPLALRGPALAPDCDLQIDFGTSRTPLHPSDLGELGKTARLQFQFGPENKHDLLAMMFLWEFATATCAQALALNPFDQPDVESAKVATRQIVQAYGGSGANKISRDQAKAFDDQAAIYAPKLLWQEIAAQEAATAVNNFSLRQSESEPLIVLSFTPQQGPLAETIEQWCQALSQKTKRAVFLQFGPRYLHSTGQAFKGGGHQASFIVITAEIDEDLEILGEPASFGVVELAQALGDYQVLADRQRSIVRLHLRGPRSVARWQAFFKGALP